MLANELYLKLNNDFNVTNLKDDWSFMDFNEYINLEFKKKYIGLMLDNTSVINKVYTATFPDSDIIEKILATEETDIMLFCHHAMGYDGTIAGFPFYNIPKDYLKAMKDRHISFYVLHVPLDKNGKYSTSVNLAKALEVEIVAEFCECERVKVGVVCKSKFEKVLDFAKHVKNIMGHEVKLRNYGSEKIKDGLIAIAAGGGSYPFVAKELVDLGISIYLTGFIRPMPSFEPTMEFHRIVEENKINVIGATHYSTEKFACLAMVEYFRKLGLASEFIEGKFYLEDL